MHRKPACKGELCMEEVCGIWKEIPGEIVLNLKMILRLQANATKSDELKN